MWKILHDSISILAKRLGNVISWEDMMRIGEEEPDEELNLREKTQSVNKACMYIYTSGTTGPPKGTYSAR